jgi:hypothetical protein
MDRHQLQPALAKGAFEMLFGDRPVLEVTRHHRLDLGGERPERREAVDKLPDPARRGAEVMGTIQAIADAARRMDGISNIAADSVAAFDHQYAKPGIGREAGDRGTGQASADDQEIRRKGPDGATDRRLKTSTWPAWNMAW